MVVIILKTTNKYLPHEDLLTKFEKAVTREFPRVIVLPYANGLFRQYFDPDKVIYLGVKGVPDRILLLSSGEYLFFDAKTGKARMTKEQLNFKQAVMRMCGKDRVHKLSSVEQGLSVVREFEGDDARKTF